MSKRISALLLAVVLVAGSVLNGNTLKVKAASATVAMSPELAAEFYLFLYQLTETAMHVGGANKGLDSKEAMKTLRDGVIGYYSVSGEKNVDFEIKTTDGHLRVIAIPDIVVDLWNIRPLTVIHISFPGISFVHCF